eukprot:Awhi_evm1s2257
MTVEGNATDGGSLVAWACLSGDIDSAIERLAELWDTGYAAIDIVSTIFRVTKAYDMSEYQKLEFLK